MIPRDPHRGTTTFSLLHKRLAHCVEHTGAGVRHAATAIAVSLLLASCRTPPAEYHDVVQHPYRLHENTASLDLAGHSPAEAIALAAQFARARPNNGSSFVITADAPTAHRIQAAVTATGVRMDDVRIVAAPQPVGIERRDLIADVEGCYGGPRSTVGIWALDDGYGHDNANSALLGCAVRRNIAAMTDDPRTLMAAEPSAPRDGARGASVYDNWAKGESTASKAQLPATTAPSGSQATGAQ
jgi:hypothetical protein